MQLFFYWYDLDQAGRNVFGLTTAVRCDQLLKGFPKKHLHDERVQSNACTKACRFLEPAVLENKVDYDPKKRCTIKFA